MFCVALTGNIAEPTAAITHSNFGQYPAPPQAKLSLRARCRVHPIVAKHGPRSFGNRPVPGGLNGVRVVVSPSSSDELKRPAAMIGLYFTNTCQTLLQDLIFSYAFSYARDVFLRAGISIRLNKVEWSTIARRHNLSTYRALRNAYFAKDGELTTRSRRRSELIAPRE